MLWFGCNKQKQKQNVLLFFSILKFFFDTRWPLLVVYHLLFLLSAKNKNKRQVLGGGSGSKDSPSRNCIFLILIKVIWLSGLVVSMLGCCAYGHQFSSRRFREFVDFLNDNLFGCETSQNFGRFLQPG